VSEVKDKKDVSVLIETQLPEFITNEHPKFKKFIEKYYEFMESYQLYFGSTFTFNEPKLQDEDENFLAYEDGDRLQLESERDIVGNANLMFTVGETLTGANSGATAVVTGTKGNTIAFVKKTNEAVFTYNEKVTGSDSRSYGNLANGVSDGTFPKAAIDAYQTKAPAVAIRELVDSQDIDTSCEGLIDDAWKKEFYTNVPKTSVADRRQLLKRMKQVYRSKGNEASFGWLFRTLFAKEDIEFYYPKTDLLKMSDGEWSLDKSIKIVTSSANNINLFTGRKIVGSLSKCTAIVEKQITSFAGALQVTELTLSDVVQGVVDGELFYFKENEIVTSETDTDGLYADATVSGILQSVTVDVGGTNYIIGDEVHITGGGGQGARARVSAILDSVVEGIDVIDSGDGYAVGDVVGFINDGTGGSGAAAQINKIVSTGAILRNTDLVSAYAVKQLSAGDYSSTFLGHNANTHLYGNSSLIFSAAIKSASAKLYDNQGNYNATQHILAGDRIAKEVTVDTSGLTITQSVKTVTLSAGLSEEEKIDVVGGKLTYANANTTIITGFNANNVLTVRDTHNFGTGQTVTIEYASNTYWGTVISANTTAFLYSVGSYYRDNDIDALTVQNFVNDDNIIVYDTKFTKLGAAADGSGSDAHSMHNGITFQVGNTPATVTTNTFTMVDAHGASPDLELVCNGALNMTSVNVGAIDSFVLTSGGGKYESKPPVTIANNYTPTLGNALDVVGAPNSILNLNLHSFFGSTGLISQDGNVVTLTSDDAWPEANSGILTLIYANGVTDQVTEVTSNTVIRVSNEKLFGQGVGDNPDKETFTLTYMALANNITKNSLLYNDDYTARGRVLDFIDKAHIATTARPLTIENGNTSLRVDMLTTQDFGSTVENILLEEKDFHQDRYSHERLLLESDTAGSQDGGGGLFIIEDSVTWLQMEDDDLICNESDQSRFYSEDTSGERVTAYSNAASAYSTGTYAQSGTTITGVGTTFPNDCVRGTFTHHDDSTTTITGYTNATSITVEDSKTVGAGNTYSMSYNRALTWGTNREITLSAGGTGNKTVTVTEEGHYLRSGDKVSITGSNANPIFNGVYPITVSNNSTYTYVLPETPGTTTPPGDLRSRPVASAWLASSNAVYQDITPRGNNAIIEVSAIAIGAIQAIEVYDFGAGYSTVPAVTTSAGDKNAELTAHLGAYATYPGYYSGTKGLLSGVPKLQDNKYYQNFSYVLKTDFDVNDYRNSVKRLVHPSGLVMFGELAIRSKVSVEMFDKGERNVETETSAGDKKYRTLVLSSNAASMNVQFSNTYWNNEIEIYTNKHPWHAMDARIEIGDEVNIQLENFEEISSIARTNSTMYVVTSTLHGLQAGDKIKWTGDESDQRFNNEYTVTTVPTTNTYTITPSPDTGSVTSQSMYDGNLYITLEDQTTGNTILLEDGDDLLMEPTSYLKSSVISYADVFRTQSTNWDNPFSGNILNEDGTDIQMERGGTYLYPTLQFPEEETGTISIDVSFNSDILLEDDNGTYGWGYLLHEESAGQGNGPQRYISLEEDTQGPDHQYESIPIVDTHILETWFNSTRAHLISEDGQDRFMMEDESLVTLDIVPITLDNSLEKEFDLRIIYNAIVTEDGHYLIEENNTSGNNYIKVEDDYGLTQNNLYCTKFNLVETTHWHLRMEDTSHIIYEDETRMLSEEDYVKAPLVEVETEHYDTMGYHLRMENEDYLQHEDGTWAIIEKSSVAGGNHVETIQYNLYETQYWHLLQEDGITHTTLEDESGRLLTEDANIKASDLLIPPVKNIYGVDTMGWHILMEPEIPELERVDIVLTNVLGDFAFDGSDRPVYTFSGGREYRFNMEHSSLRPSETPGDWHPIRFSTTNNGTHGGGTEYTTGVTVVGEPGTSGAYVSFIPPEDTNIDIWYYCLNHSGMGNTTTASKIVTYNTVYAVTAAGGAFFIDGVSRALVSMTGQRTYRFDLSDASNRPTEESDSWHPLRFSKTNNGTHGGGTAYTDGVVINGDPGTSGAYIEIRPSNDTQKLHYYCVNHAGMGSEIFIEANIIDDVYLAMEDVHKDLGSVNNSRILQDIQENKPPVITKEYVTEEAPSDMQRWTPANHELDYIETWQDTKVTRTFGMQPFRPHYVSNWSDANLYYVDDKFTQEDDSGLILLEHGITDQDYLIQEDFPEVNQDLLNLQREELHGILLEDELQTLGTVDGRAYDYLAQEDWTIHTVTVTNPTGDQNVFVIDGIVQPQLRLERTTHLRFDVSDSTMAGHPFRLSTTAHGSHAGGTELTAGVNKIVNGTEGQAGAYVEFYLEGSVPDLLYYYCTAHNGMGTGAGHPTNVYKKTGTDLILHETSKPFNEEYGVDYTPQQAWAVLPSYRYSRILTRLKGTITFPDGGTTGTGDGSEFLTQLSVGEEFQTADENIIDEETGGGILLETDERIEHEELRIFHVQNEDLAADLMGIQIRNFRWLITTEDTTISAHGSHAGVTGEYSTPDFSSETYWILTDDTNQALVVGLDHEVGQVEQESPEWENINMLWEDGSKMIVTDPQAFIVSAINSDTELVVTRKHLGGTDDSVYQL